MTDFHGFRGAAKPLDDIDLPRIGHRIGVGEDEIHAVLDVETAGGAWDARGRPKMLFEPHRFWKNLGPGEKRDRAARAGLAYPSWGEKPYPKDSYPRLVEAMAIDEAAALKSASWGLGQVLGENHAMVGHETVQSMVLALLDDADAHLEQMVAFIQAAKLDGKLRAHDWTGFARGYNGPQHAKHDYAGRLARSYAKWSKIRDTAWSPEAAAPIVVPVPTPRPSGPAYDPVEKIDTPPQIGHNGGPPIAPPSPTGGPTSKATGGAIGAGLPNVLLLLAVKLGAIPAAAASDPETLLYLTAVLTVAGSWIGTYLAPRNAQVQP